MVWFKVDDGFHSHRKTIAAGNAAIGLWARCGSWSSDQEHDGFVPREVALHFGNPRLVAQLLKAGLWHEADGGYQFHDFEDYNPLAEQVQQLREARREAGSRGGKRTAEAKQRGSKSEASAQASAAPVAEAKSKPVPVPEPTTDVLRTSAAPTITQRSKRITDAYAEQVPLSNWPAVNGVVLKALKSERYADDEICAATLRLAKDGRAVTVDVLRTELEGFGSRAKPSAARQRMNEADQVIAQFERLENGSQIREIGR